MQYAIVDDQGLPVKPGEAADVTRYVLNHMGVKNPELFVLRGMRRVQPTMLGQRSAPEAEKVAVGDWQGCESRTGPAVAAMPVLYDHDKVRTAAFTKMVQVLALKEIATSTKQTLDWKTFRTQVRELDIKKLYEEADQAIQNDEIVDQIPGSILPSFIEPTKQFYFSRDRSTCTWNLCKAFKTEPEDEKESTPLQLAAEGGDVVVPTVKDSREEGFAGAKCAVDAVAPPVQTTAVVSELVDQDMGNQDANPAPSIPTFNEVIGELPLETVWQITSAKIHFANSVGAPPWCSQRHGQRARPLKRLAASGVGVQDLLNMQFQDDINLKLCRDCLKSRP